MNPYDGPWYHGSPVELQAGTLLFPATVTGTSSWSVRVRQPRVYITELVSLAEFYSFAREAIPERACLTPPGFVYRVHPVGEVLRDDLAEAFQWHCAAAMILDVVPRSEYLWSTRENATTLDACWALLTEATMRGFPYHDALTLVAIHGQPLQATVWRGDVDNRGAHAQKLSPKHAPALRNVVFTGF